MQILASKIEYELPPINTDSNVMDKEKKLLIKGKTLNVPRFSIQLH